METISHSRSSEWEEEGELAGLAPREQPFFREGLSCYFSQFEYICALKITKAMTASGEKKYNIKFYKIQLSDNLPLTSRDTHC